MNSMSQWTYYYPEIRIINSRRYKELLLLTNYSFTLLVYGLFSGSHLQTVPYLGWLFTLSCFPLKFKLQRFFDFECEKSDSEFAWVCFLRRSWRVASFFKFMSEYGQPKALVCMKREHSHQFTVINQGSTVNGTDWHPHFRNWIRDILLSLNTLQ